jgi:hypothetical protein
MPPAMPVLPVHLAEDWGGVAAIDQERSDVLADAEGVKKDGTRRERCTG